MPERQINWPIIKEHFAIFRSSQLLPHLSLPTLKGLFELTQRPSRALNWPRALLPELQRYKGTVRCVALGTEVPGLRQIQLTQTLIVCLLKTRSCTHQSLIVKSQQNRIELVARPEGAASTQSAMVTSSMMTSLFLDGLLLLQGTNPIELGPGLVEDETAKSWSKETVLKKKRPVISR